jgi:integrase
VASLRKHPKSKFWYACITLADGRQTQRSTREIDRKRAFRIAEKYEEASKRRLSEAQTRKVIRDLYELHNHEALDSSTAADFLMSWLERKRVETQPTTFAKYQGVINQFLTFLGDHKTKDLNFISRRQISDFQQSIATRLSPVTANLALKILRVAFKQAYRDGLIQNSPADQIKVIANKTGERERRGPFTIDQLRAIYRHADEEWKGMILFGLYSGQRLKDIATLTSGNIDLEADELRLITHKTHRQQIIPLATPLRDFILEKLLNNDNPNSPLFPRAYAVVEKSGTVQSLSNAFYEILVSGGLAPTRSKANTGRGRSVKRRTNPLSFHSLRHTATSLMKNAGISPAIVQDIIGHDSPEISRHYTTIEASAKRKAIDLIPDVLKISSK